MEGERERREAASVSLDSELFMQDWGQGWDISLAFTGVHLGGKKRWGSHRFPCGSNQNPVCQASRALGDT